ncbi:polyribonucleotide nucleotidyltransferase 2, mitochondrial-like [Malania oleifera]|uniref:polyribonucleotide nucleotidyltransferase 2, mitochondrial-like n=1 Tax=Malania oleifera TaxID=397392 RepID=UPI0025AE6C8F|nr:polyribonucleotide nucleotidyltransferase 2, mitochondrial-like [Malania oleifera]
MEQEINAPRTQHDRNSPRLATLKFSNDALRRLIGPMGVVKEKIEEETGARISVGNGTLTILAKNQSVMERAQEEVDFIIGREIEIGGIYKGVVTSVKEFGAFVELNGGQQGLLHISELSHDLVSRVSDVVSVGQQLSVMCIEKDVRGNFKLSLKATVPKPGSEEYKVAEKSISPTKQAPNISSLADVSDEQESQDSSIFSPPPIVIRSAAE